MAVVAPTHHGWVVLAQPSRSPINDSWIKDFDDVNWGTLHEEEGETTLQMFKKKADELKELHETYSKEFKNRKKPSEDSSSHEQMHYFLKEMVEGDAGRKLAEFWSELRPVDFVLMLESQLVTRGGAKMLDRLSLEWGGRVVAGECPLPCFVEACTEFEPNECTLCCNPFVHMAVCGISTRMKYPRRGYHVELTKAMQVYPNDGSARDQTMVISALANTDGNEVYVTPIVLAITTQAWGNMRWQNYGCCFFHAALLSLLLWFGHLTYKGVLPGAWLMRLYSVLWILELAYRIGELVGAGVLFGVKSWRLGLSRVFGGFWNLGYAVMHWVGLACSLFMLYNFFYQQSGGQCTNTSHCWFKVHNVLYMILITSRCAMFLMRLLCWEPLGQASLPAINAMKARRTVWYVMFLVIFWLLAAAAFYVQPIGMGSETNRICHKLHNQVAEETCRMFAFLDKVFNVAFMGQFDVQDLENVNEEINATLVGDHLLQGNIGDSHWSNYHVGTEVWQIASGFFINILALNVFISIVSTEYEKTCEHAVASLMRYRSHFMFRDLLPRVAWEHFFPKSHAMLQQQGQRESHTIYIKDAEYKKMNSKSRESKLEHEVDRLREENFSLRQQLEQSRRTWGCS